MTEAIMNRISIRSYIDKPVTKMLKKQIQRMLQNAGQGPFGHTVRLELLDGSELSNQEIHISGAFGVVSNAPLYIAGAVKIGKHSLEDFGYCMEKVILKATQLGFGTCWIAENFKREHFGKRINAGENETVAAICPLGYFQQKKALSLQIMRLMANNRKRESWPQLFFRGSFTRPMDAAGAGKYAIPLEAVRVAPSAANKQPWRIARETDTDVFHFYLKKHERFNPAFGPYTVQHIDMGIALCHFEVSAGELGINGSWEHREPIPPRAEMEYIASWVEAEKRET